MHDRYRGNIARLHSECKILCDDTSSNLTVESGRVGSGPVGVCVIGLQLNFLLHSSLVPDCLVGSGHPYNSTVELGWVMCHGL